MSVQRRRIYRERQRALPRTLYASGRYRRVQRSAVGSTSAASGENLRLLASCAYSTARLPDALSMRRRSSRELRQRKPRDCIGKQNRRRSLLRKLWRAPANSTPVRPRCTSCSGDVYRQRKHYPDAEQEYRKALAIRAGELGRFVRSCLGTACRFRARRSTSAGGRCFEKESRRSGVQCCHGEILCARHDFSGAEPYLKKALNTKPELVPHVHALLGRVYAETNRTQQAIAELKLASGR